MAARRKKVVPQRPGAGGEGVPLSRVTENRAGPRDTLRKVALEKVALKRAEMRRTALKRAALKRAASKRF